MNCLLHVMLFMVLVMVLAVSVDALPTETEKRAYNCMLMLCPFGPCDPVRGRTVI